LLCDIILQWFAEDTRPELLDKLCIILVNLFPRVVLGHAKLDPVWKDNLLEFRVQRLRMWITTRNLDVVLRRYVDNVCISEKS